MQVHAPSSQHQRLKLILSAQGRRVAELLKLEVVQIMLGDDWLNQPHLRSIKVESQDLARRQALEDSSWWLWHATYTHAHAQPSAQTWTDTK